MTTPNLVTVRFCASLIDAQMVKLRLDRAGMFCHLANEYLARLDRGAIGSSAGFIWVQVPDFEAERARAILDQQQDELSEIDASVLDTKAAESENCPSCGSARIEYNADKSGATRGVCRACAHRWAL